MYTKKIALCVALTLIVFSSSPSMAVLTSTPVIPQTPRLYVARGTATGTQNFTNGSAGTSGANGTKISGMICSNTDTATHTITIQVSRGGNATVLGTVLLAASAGNANGTAAVNLFGSGPNGPYIPGLPVDNNAQPYLLLDNANTDTLQMVIAGTFTAGTVSCASPGSDY